MPRRRERSVGADGVHRPAGARRRASHRGRGEPIDLSSVLEIEIVNRSGVGVETREIEALCRSVLAAEQVASGDLGVALVGPEEMRALKREHLRIDEATDVLSFPIDGRDELPAEVPRQLGDVVLCPQVVGEEWRRPLVHGLLHTLGYEHGREMEEREEALLA